MSHSSFAHFRGMVRAAAAVGAAVATPTGADAGTGGAVGVSEAEARIVPVWRDCLFDVDTPVSAFAKLRREPFGFLLESAPAGSETWARYTYLGTQPRAAWRFKSGVVSDWDSARGWHNERTPVDPLADLDAIISSPRPVDVPE